MDSNHRYPRERSLLLHLVHVPGAVIAAAQSAHKRRRVHDLGFLRRDQVLTAGELRPSGVLCQRRAHGRAVPQVVVRCWRSTPAKSDTIAYCTSVCCWFRRLHRGFAPCRALAVAQPVVDDVAIIEWVLPVGELARDCGAQDQLGGAELDGVAKALDRDTVFQVGGDQLPDGLAVGQHHLLDHVFDLLW
jgi:hypothetical protein